MMAKEDWARGPIGRKMFRMSDFGGHWNKSLEFEGVSGTKGGRRGNGEQGTGNGEWGVDLVD
jgi:hypothetical protein